MGLRQREGVLCNIGCLVRPRARAAAVAAAAVACLLGSSLLRCGSPFLGVVVVAVAVTLVFGSWLLCERTVLSLSLLLVVAWPWLFSEPPWSGGCGLVLLVPVPV